MGNLSVLLATSASLIVISYAITLLTRSQRSQRCHLRCNPEDIGLKVDVGKEKEKGAQTDTEYDVVIIGGGTAGCVLASRLSEDRNIRVLLLEAGGSGVAIPFSRIPSACNRTFHSANDYDLHTVSQTNANNKVCYWPRAKLLGGCSSINAMIFHAGAPTDYDEWARSGEEGASEWAYDKFHQYFLKFENFLPHKDFPLVDRSSRGSSGPVSVGYFGNFSQVCASFISACENVGIPHSHDVNTAKGSLGATKIMTYIDRRGHRVSTETAYLTSDVLARPNLTIATRAQVTRILFETTESSKRAVGVEFAETRDGPRYRVNAKREVVLSAGAVHTPHILMLSGVGPATHLASKSIPVVHDLPGVGSHLMDHPVVNVRYRAKAGESLNYLKPTSAWHRFRIIPLLIEWSLRGTGPLTSNLVEAAAFVRSSDMKLFPPSDYPAIIDDATSSSNAPDIELISSPFAWTDHGLGPVPAGDLASLGAVLLRPTSTGTVTLKSVDPFDAPIIDPNYLATRHDVDVLIRGLKLALRIARTEPLASLLVHSETDPLLDHQLHETGDEYIEQVVRTRVETLYHPTSTARMASLIDSGVVDPALRVHGIPNLRIVDASIFPTIPSGHTAAPTIAVAEKASDMIRAHLTARDAFSFG